MPATNSVLMHQFRSTRVILVVFTSLALTTSPLALANLVGQFQRFTTSAPLQGDFTFRVTPATNPLNDSELGNLCQHYHVRCSGNDFIRSYYQMTNDSLPRPFDLSSVAVFADARYWHVLNGTISTWQDNETVAAIAMPEYTLLLALHEDRRLLTTFRTLGLCTEVAGGCTWSGMNFTADGYYLEVKTWQGIPQNATRLPCHADGTLVVSNNVPRFAIVTNRVHNRPMAFVSRVDYSYEAAPHPSALPTSFRKYNHIGGHWLLASSWELLAARTDAQTISAQQTFLQLQATSFLPKDPRVMEYTGRSVQYTNAKQDLVNLKLRSPPRGFIHALLANQSSIVFIFITLLSFPILLFCVRRYQNRNQR